MKHKDIKVGDLIQYDTEKTFAYESTFANDIALVTEIKDTGLIKIFWLRSQQEAFKYDMDPFAKVEP